MFRLAKSFITSVMCIFSWFALPLAGNGNFQESRYHHGRHKQSTRIASARAFVHSLNILVKYVRLYGLDHKRTEGQFTVTWNELQEGLPKGAEAPSCWEFPKTNFCWMARRSKPGRRNAASLNC